MEIASAEDTRIIYQPVNQGKGAAVRIGLKHARGDVVLVLGANGKVGQAAIQLATAATR